MLVVWLDLAQPQERDYMGLSPATAALRLRLRAGAVRRGGGAAAGTPLTLELRVRRDVVQQT